MDNIIKKTFEDTINSELISIIISNSTDKKKASKIKIRKVLLKDTLHYQVSEFIGNKVFHTNYIYEELIDKLPDWFEGLFQQAEIITSKEKVTILISKKGKVTVNHKLIKNTEKNEMVNSNEIQNESLGLLSHNKKKNYILQENTPLPFLIDLGVMTKEGLVVRAKSDKFRQINRFLEYIEDVLPYLEKGKELTILDFGCGKSYLTFAMYYYLKILKGYQINVIGLDLKSDVIENCNKLSVKYGYEKLHFLEGDIASYQGSSSVDMVVTLHACDTATDYALYKAVSWGAQVILSVPCCQHELNRQIQGTTLKPVLKYGIVKERMAALITDALRAELLEQKGYKVQLLEFIDMEHTPKNILIRAVKRSTAFQVTKMQEDELQKCMDFLGVTPCLQKLLNEEL
ncbi:MAG: SAM-dependent methyltransferase [Herbinix sp.]|nr:SAM-dependent methyltransferase [Herbinix sp.]